MPSSEKKPAKEYKVGKNRPPKEHQWKRGQSGNPKGRPKIRKAEQMDIVGTLNSSVDVQIRGKKRKISAFEASIRQTAKDAIAGDLRSIKQFLNLCDKHKLFAGPEDNQPGGVVFAPKGMSPQEWLAEIAEKEVIDD